MKNGKLETMETDSHYCIIVYKGGFSKTNQSHLRKLKRLRNELTQVLKAHPPEKHV